MLVPAVSRHFRVHFGLGKRDTEQRNRQKHISHHLREITMVNSDKPISTPRIEYGAGVIIYHVFKKNVWINPVLGHLRTRINVFCPDPYRMCCIPTTVSLQGQGEEKGSVRELMEEDSLQSAPAEELR